MFSNGSWFEFVGPHWKNAGCEKNAIDNALILSLNCHFYKDMVLPVWEEFKDEGPVNPADIDKPQYAVFKRVYTLKAAFKDNIYASFSKLSTYVGKPDVWVSGMGTKTHLIGFLDNKVSSINRVYIVRIYTEVSLPCVACVCPKSILVQRSSFE